MFQNQTSLNSGYEDKGVLVINRQEQDNFMKRIDFILNDEEGGLRVVHQSPLTPNYYDGETSSSQRNDDT